MSLVNTLINRETLCDEIATRRNTGKFGFNESQTHIKGVVYEFNDFHLLACAGGNYITIATKSKNEGEWSVKSCHSSCWRWDGVDRVLKGDQELFSEKEVLVRKMNERTIREVIYL